MQSIKYEVLALYAQYNDFSNSVHSDPGVPDCLVPPSPTGGWAWQSNSTKGHYTLMYIVLLCYVYYTRTGVLKSIDVDIEFFETMILDFTIIIIPLTTDLIFVTNITNYIC